MKFNLMTSASTLALGGAFALVAPGQAEATLTCTAATFSCTESISYTNQQTNFSKTPAFDRFDPATGTLQSVMITERIDAITSTGTLKNKGGGSDSFTFSGGLALTLKPVAGSPANFPTLLKQASITTKTYSSVPSGATVLYTASSSAPVSLSQTLTSGFGDFEGSGTFTAALNGKAYNTLVNTGGNITAIISTYGDETVSITYAYSTAVPEPAALAVLGSGLVGIGVLRRRRVS